MGVILPHELWGRGAPALLLHGFTGSRRSFDHLRPRLEQHLSAIAVDLPGHGDASPPPEGRDGFLATVDALAKTLDAAKVERADVIGYSQGARLGLAFAVRHPSRVARLILESGSPGLRRRKDRAERRLSDEQLAASIELQGVDAFIRRWEALPLFEGIRRLPPVTLQDLRARRTSHSPNGLAAALRGMGIGVQPDLWPELHAVRAPTLLLSGAEDQKFTQIAKQMAAELPMVWGRVFAGCGHAPHLEAAAEWADEVIGFLSTPWFDQAQSQAALHET